MSGVYNYHPTIANPSAHYPALDSQQAPFHFGASQVPIALHPSIPTVGSGIYKNHVSEGKERKMRHKDGRGLKVDVDKNERIAIPKLLKRI